MSSKEPPQMRSAIHVLLGRGRTGKSSYARWMYECSTAVGRVLTMVDGDRSNATLASFITDARRPLAADDATASAFLENVTAEIIENGGNVVIDMGGGDLLFSEFAYRRKLVQVLDNYNIQLVLYFFAAGGRDDFEILKKATAMGLTSKKTVILLNEGLAGVSIEGQDPFASLLAGKAVTECIANGAVVVRIPAVALSTMVAADSLFIDLHLAAAGEVPNDKDGKDMPNAERLPFWLRAELSEWLSEMSDRHDEAGVSGWLP